MFRLVVGIILIIFIVAAVATVVSFAVGIALCLAAGILIWKLIRWLLVVTAGEHYRRELLSADKRAPPSKDPPGIQRHLPLIIAITSFSLGCWLLSLPSYRPSRPKYVEKASVPQKTEVKVEPAREKVKTAQTISYENFWKVTLPANAGWYDTGIDLDGEYSIEATGQINFGMPKFNGPNGYPGMIATSGNSPLLGVNNGALIGKIGERGKPFLIGEYYHGTAKGRLCLTVNDGPGDLYNNSGAFTLRIEKKKPQLVKPVTVLVYANRPRNPTGITVEKGEKYRIASRGSWRWDRGFPDHVCGAEGFRSHPGLVVPNAPLASLVGFVKEKGFPIGGNDEFVSPESGLLYLALNDVPGEYGDNKDYLEVTILPVQVDKNIEEPQRAEPKVPHVTARVSNADDKAVMYVNGQQAISVTWGTGPGGNYVGHRPGDSGWIDITPHLKIGDNTLRFWVWNEAIHGAVSATFEVQVDGVPAISRNFKKEDSTEGVKYNETVILSIPGSRSKALQPKKEQKAPKLAPRVIEPSTPKGQVKERINTSAVFENELLKVELVLIEKLKDGKMRLSLVHTNKTNHSVYIFLPTAKESTYLADNLGNQYTYTDINNIPTSGYDFPGFRANTKELAPDIPVKGSITFPEPEEPATSFNLVGKYGVYTSSFNPFGRPGEYDIGYAQKGRTFNVILKDVKLEEGTNE